MMEGKSWAKLQHLQQQKDGSFVELQTTTSLSAQEIFLGKLSGVAHSWVSNKHVRICLDASGSSVYVEDMSTNGSFLRRAGSKDFVKLVKAKATALEEGDVLSLVDPERIKSSKSKQPEKSDIAFAFRYFDFDASAALNILSPPRKNEREPSPVPHAPPVSVTDEGEEPLFVFRPTKRARNDPDRRSAEPAASYKSTMATNLSPTHHSTATNSYIGPARATRRSQYTQQGYDEESPEQGSNTDIKSKVSETLDRQIGEEIEKRIAAEKNLRKKIQEENVLNAKMAELKAELLCAKEQVSEMEKRMGSSSNDKQRKLSSVEGSLATKTSQLEQRETENARLREEIVEMKKQSRRQEDRLREAQQECVHLKRDVSMLSDELKMSQLRDKENKEAREKSSVAEVDLLALKKKYAKVVKEREDFESQAKSALAEKSKIERSLKSAHATIESLEKEAQETKSVFEEKNDAIAHVEAECALLREAARKHDQTVQECEQQRLRLQRDAESTVAEREMYKEENTSLKRQIDDLEIQQRREREHYTGEIQSLQGQLRQADVSRSEMEEQFAIAQREMQEWMEQCREHKTTRFNVEQQMEVLRNNYRKQGTLLAEAKDRLKRLLDQGREDWNFMDQIELIRAEEPRDAPQHAPRPEEEQTAPYETNTAEYSTSHVPNTDSGQHQQQHHQQQQHTPHHQPHHPHHHAQTTPLAPPASERRARNASPADAYIQLPKVNSSSASSSTNSNHTPATTTPHPPPPPHQRQELYAGVGGTFGGDSPGGMLSLGAVATSSGSFFDPRHTGSSNKMPTRS